jgi:hypothetical protein
MNAIARRGIVCWVGLSLCGSALYAQETTAEDPKKLDRVNLGAGGEDVVQKLRAELKARVMEVEKVQAQLRQAEAAKQSLAAELERLSQALQGVATEKNVVEERARKQVDELAAKLREMMTRERADEVRNRTYPNPFKDDGKAASPENKLRLDRQIESARQYLEATARATAAEAMKRTADTLGHVARQAEGAATQLNEARPDVPQGPSEIDQGWQRLMDRADVMLEKSRSNEEIAAKYLPKLESAVTQLRKAGRIQEADELMTVANSLLGRSRPSPNMPRDYAPPEDPRRNVRDPNAAGDVKQAIDELRRQVEQLRGEVRELRDLLQRGKANAPKSDERTEHRIPAGTDAVVIVTIVANANGEPRVYLADGENGPWLDPTQQADDIREAIARSIKAGHNTVIIKADHNVRQSDVVQVVRLASIKGATVHVSVRDAGLR